MMLVDTEAARAREKSCPIREAGRMDGKDVLAPRAVRLSNSSVDVSFLSIDNESWRGQRTLEDLVHGYLVDFLES
jgi:hypothetical protein